MTCIICNCILQPKIPEDPNVQNLENIYPTKIQQNTNKFILHSFCRYFSIKLPLGPIKWDFAKESVPFCPACKRIAGKLVRLRRKLEILEKEVGQTESWVREEMSKVSNASKINPKDSSAEDSRAQAIRDIIVGPCLKIRRMPLTSLNVSRLPVKEELVEEDFHCDAFLEVDFAPADSPLNDNPSEIRKPLFATKTGRKRSNKDDFPKKTKRAKVLKKKDTKGKKNVKVSQDRGKTRRKIKAIDKEEEMDQIDQIDEIDQVQDSNDSLQDDFGGDSNMSVEEQEDSGDEDFELREKRSVGRRRGRKGSSKGESSTEEEKKGVRKKYIKVQHLGEDRYSYGEHEYSGNDKDGYKCGQCPDGHVYPKRRNILLHVVKMHSKDQNFLCPICGKELKRASIKYHMDSHDDNCIAICEVCGKECRGTEPLKQHVKLCHILELKVVCEVCGKKFKTNSSLKHHMKAVHLQEKNVFCELCGKGFYGPSYLKLHMQGRHSNEKLHCCTLCGQRFVQKGSYTRHMQQFHNQPSAVTTSTISAAQPAPAPSTSFQEQDDTGGVVPSGDASLRCKLCGLQYNRQNNLTRHLLQIHHINVKGLAWKHKAPKKILENVTLQPRPDLVNKTSGQVLPEVGARSGRETQPFVPTIPNIMNRTEPPPLLPPPPPGILNPVSNSALMDAYSSIASSVWERGYNSNVQSNNI